MTALAVVLGLASWLFGVSTLIEPRSRATLVFVWTKFLSNAWAPHLALIGALGAVLGAIAGSPIAIVFGLAGFVISQAYVLQVTRVQGGLDHAFGADWPTRIGADALRRMVGRRWGLRPPWAPEARTTWNLPFATVPGTTRALVCDLWQPASGTPRSGTAIVYLHGSAWCLMDKDVGTRLLFRHLATQGHVVMDVAYRLCPETDVIGMVADGKRAVAWMKAHAAEYGVHPDGVVLMGSSAGAHVALLAAYTPGHPRLTPDDLRGVDTRVRAVVSYYGIPDMHDYDASARRFLPPGPPPFPQPQPPLGPRAKAMYRRMFGRDLNPENLPPPPTHRKLMGMLLGGLPEDVPEMYDLASPIRHVTAQSPPTMHLQGTHDQIAPIASARRLHRALDAVGVPAVFVEYPNTGHAFDLIVPALLGPAGQAALYDVERFVACAALEPAAASDAGSALAASAR